MAVLVLLIDALLPATLLAAAGSQPGPTVALCHANPDSSSGKPSAVAPMGCCALCLAAAPLLPCAAAAISASQSLSFATYATALRAVARLRPHRFAAQPRAPPAPT